MANPNYGISVGADFLVEQQQAAVRNTRDQGRFLTKHLNRWVNAKTTFFNLQSWNSNRVDLDTDDLKGKPCVIALDLAAEQDIAAMQFLFPQDDGPFFNFGRYYLPEDVIREPGREHYAGWLRAGRLVEAEGNMTDLSRIQDDLIPALETYAVRKVVYDPFQAVQIMGTLSNLSVPIIKMGQGRRDMHAPMHYLAAAIDGGRVHHGDGPLDPMTWMMSTVEIKGATTSTSQQRHVRD